MELLLQQMKANEQLQQKLEESQAVLERKDRDLASADKRNQDVLAELLEKNRMLTSRDQQMIEKDRQLSQ